MPPRPRTLTATDHAAWADYARHVRTLKGRAQPASLPASPPAPPTPGHTPLAQPRPPAVSAVPPRALPPPLVTGAHPPGLDRASWARFRGGKLPAARTLDLHGKTAQAAFHALERFLLAAHAEGLRCVEVITGRGAGEQGGVIRRELPMWLNLPRLRPLVLATAHPHAANAGSTRLLLRRVRG